MTVTEILNTVLNKKNILKQSFAELIGIKPNNLANRLNRENYTASELCGIADVLNMELLLRDKESGEEYIIDYPEELKFKPKRIDKK